MIWIDHHLWITCHKMHLNRNPRVLLMLGTAKGLALKDLHNKEMLVVRLDLVLQKQAIILESLQREIMKDPIPNDFKI